VKPPPFVYLRPASLPEAIHQLATFPGDAKVLAGGQSLIPLLNLRMSRFDALVDIARLPELDYVRPAGDRILIGAGSRQRTIERSPVLLDHLPLLPHAVRHVAHPQIRNLGTVGGSIAHADPAAELPVVVLALDAVFLAQGPDGSREIGADDFFLGPFTTPLEPAEVLTQVAVPVVPGARTSFVEFARRAGDFAVAAVAAVGVLDAGSGAVSELRLAAGGVGPVPRRLPATEAALLGLTLTPASLRIAADTAAAEVDPPDDAQADAGYRRALLSALVERALQELRP
jgi:CO/xanthine dehydrogenase FAD-binding subunit